MGFEPTGRGKGSHDVWKDSSGLLFTIPVHGKDLEYGVAKTLLKLIRSRQTELEEMAGEIHGGVRQVLKDKGYQYLGSGIDKQAWLEPGTGQVLIVFGYRKGVDDFSPDQRMFIDWITYCNKNKNNPHLPRFSGFESFEFQGKKYIQARMEPLDEVPARIKELVSYLDHAADHMGTNDLGAALKRLSSFAGNWDEEADEFKYDTVEQIVDFLGGPDRAANLLNTIYQVKEFSKQHGYSLDLHSGNYMQRADGTIVVNDPFVLWLKDEN
jgi:predicted RNA binding protein YcfA (HicA-like mRNA interferase family)